jgi:hypothetical protein
MPIAVLALTYSEFVRYRAEHPGKDLISVISPDDVYKCRGLELDDIETVGNAFRERRIRDIYRQLRPLVRRAS